MKRILQHSRYNPGRGGHAPGDLRNAFAEGLEALLESPPGTGLPIVEFREQSLPMEQLAGLLWNCTDGLPSDPVRAMEHLLPPGYELRRWTYAAACRLLRELSTTGVL